MLKPVPDEVNALNWSSADLLRGVNRGPKQSGVWTADDVPGSFPNAGYLRA